MSIPDCEFITQESAPRLPIFTKLIAIPDCQDVAISITQADKKRFNKYNILPVSRFEKKKDRDGNYRQLEIIEENKSIYAMNVEFPGKYGEIIDTGHVRGQKVARVVLYPIQFNPVSKTLDVYTDFDVQLTFINPTSAVNKELGIFRNMMHHSALNYELTGIGASSGMNLSNQKKGLSKVNSGSVLRVSDPYSLIYPTAIPVDYLIITTPDLFNSNSLTTLANHRKDYNGYDVAIIKLDYHIYGNHPPSEYFKYLHGYITQLYNMGVANHTGDGHLGFILLVGDALRDDNSTQMLPAAYPTGYTDREQGGDYYYAAIHYACDPFQDIMYGRLPVGNETELNNNVNKILSYEYNSNGSWCTDYTLVAGSYDIWENSSDWGIRECTEVIPPTYTKSYGYRALNTAGLTQVIEANPKLELRYSKEQYNNPAYLCGADILDNWIYDDAVAGVNNRIHTFIYEGHGSYKWLGGEGSGRAMLSIQDPGDGRTVYNKLQNDLYSFMILCCCDAGKFDNTAGDCVAEVVVNLPNKGAIGALASTRQSGEMIFGLVDREILNAMHNSMSHIMGEAIMESKLNISIPQYRYQFNLYGDPAVKRK